MEILKNKWTWIILGIILLVVVMRHNKMTLSSLFGTSDNFSEMKSKEKESDNYAKSDEKSDGAENNNFAGEELSEMLKG